MCRELWILFFGFFAKTLLWALDNFLGSWDEITGTIFRAEGKRIFLAWLIACWGFDKFLLNNFYYRLVNLWHLIFSYAPNSSTFSYILNWSAFSNFLNSAPTLSKNNFGFFHVLTSLFSFISRGIFKVILSFALHE